MIGQLLLLVLVRLHLDDGPGCGAVRGHDGVAFARDAESALHGRGVCVFQILGAAVR